MVPSLSIRQSNVIPWLTGISTTEQDVNILLSVIAQDLYDAGTAAVAKIKVQHHSIAAVQAWPSAFSGISVISNRRTLFHRDQGGWPACFDFLAAAGTYDSGLLLCPDLGAKFIYSPGTAVALCGKMLRHGVFDWSGGERLCYAHFMRDNVHNRLGIQQTGWVDIKDYFPHMSEEFQKRMARDT
jgi:hypothetical protein